MILNNMNEENFILYEWNVETKEFWFLGEKIDYIHNPQEWRKHLNNLVTENKKLKQENQQLKEDLEKSIKVQIKTNKILIGIEKWINDYINALEKQSETIEGLDVFEEHTLIVLDDVKTILNELKDSDIK